MKKRTKRLLTASGIISAALVLAACDKQEEPGEFDPSSNELEDVYGPPDMFNPGVFEEEENMLPCVYGPPEAFESVEDYEPEENVADPLYGPPTSTENSQGEQE